MAPSLSPTLSNECVLEILQIFTALAAAEPDEEELLRAVEKKVNAASRLLHVSTDSVFYRLSGRSACEFSCETQLDVHKRDLQRHMMSLTASFARAPIQSSILSPLPTCVHRGHVLRVSALACLRVLLLRHSPTLTDPVLSLRSIYRWHACCRSRCDVSHAFGSGGAGGGGGCIITHTSCDLQAAGFMPAPQIFSTTRSPLFFNLLSLLICLLLIASFRCCQTLLHRRPSRYRCLQQASAVMLRPLVYCVLSHSLY